MSHSHSNNPPLSKAVQWGQEWGTACAWELTPNDYFVEIPRLTGRSKGRNSPATKGLSQAERAWLENRFGLNSWTETKENTWSRRQEARVTCATLTWEKRPRAFDGDFMRRCYGLRGKGKKGRNKELGAWILGMKPKLEYAKTEKIGRSDHKIRENLEAKILYPVHPHYLQKRTGDIRRRTWKLFQSPSHKPYPRYPEIFYDLKRIHDLNLRQISARNYQKK